MNYAPLLLWLVSLAQITSGTPGTGIPDDATIFTVKFKNGDIVSAAIKADDDFITEFDKSRLPNQVEIYLDTPWAPVPPRKELLQNFSEVAFQDSLKRRQRYKDSGFEQVETPQGKVWVSKEMVARAGRAAVLQANLQSEWEAHHAAFAVTAEAGGSESGGPGFVQRWGRHVVILVTAVVAIVAAIKICF